jgi:hypothetical protein
MKLRINVRLEPEQIRYLESININKSEAIREVINFHKENQDKLEILCRQIDEKVLNSIKLLIKIKK